MTHLWSASRPGDLLVRGRHGRRHPRGAASRRHALEVAWGWHEPELLIAAGAERVAASPAELLTIVAPELTSDFFGAG